MRWQSWGLALILPILAGGWRAGAAQEPAAIEADTDGRLDALQSAVTRLIEQKRMLEQQATNAGLLLDTYGQRPRKVFIGATTEEYRFAQYVEDWRTKIERVGTEYFPITEDGQRLYGNLLMTIEINADGTVHQATVARSSGNPELDAAAVHIVELASPFAPFPPEIRKDTDILVINRTWTFAHDDLPAEDDSSSAADEAP